jgi:hypothetical protein
MRKDYLQAMLIAASLVGVAAPAWSQQATGIATDTSRHVLSFASLIRCGDPT